MSEGEAGSGFGAAADFRVSRRRLLGAAGVAAVPLMAIGAGIRPGSGMQGPAATPLTSVGLATPVASPQGSPVATPQATPLATPPPPPLEVIRDQRPAYATRPERSGTLRMLRPPAEGLSFNPTSFRQDYQVLTSYLDPLLRADPLTLEPEPWLAESWDVGADGLEIRFQLRDDVRWHDDTRFTAQDVVFSLLAYRDDFDTGVRNLFTLTEKVEAVGEFEVLVRLAAPDPGWLFNAATQLMFQAAQYGPVWERAAPGERSLAAFDGRESVPVGTGPWRVISVAESGVGFARNADYWQEPPWFDELTIGWEGNRRNQIAAWRAGDADLIWPFRSEDVPLVEDLPGRLYVAEAASVMFAAFNFANPTGLPRFFDDLRLREALNMAVDRERYAAEVFDGGIVADASGTVAQPWAHADQVRSPRFDPKTASELLAEAGWVDYNGDGTIENGAGVPFDLTVIVAEDARRELILVLRSMKDDWAKVGVALRIQILRPDEFRERALRGLDYDLIAYSYDLYPGFTDFDLYGSAWDIRTNPQGWNPGGYANADADAAIAGFLAATSVDGQREALQRLQVAVNDDLFGIWFGFPADLVLAAIDIDGFQPNKVWQTADTRLLWRTDRERVVDRSG